MPPFTELFREKTVRIALGVVGVILVASAVYYFMESRPPTVSLQAPVVSTTTDIVANGVVTPVENPNLSFEIGGQVTNVAVSVGQKVSAGTLLATLDTGILSANYAAAQANLAGLEAGPRGVDLAGKTTAVQAAQTALSNEYGKLAAVLSSVENQAEDAVHATDPLFSPTSYPDYPHISFISGDSAASETAGRDRKMVISDADLWSASIASLSSNSTPSVLDAELEDSISKLTSITTYLADLSTSVNAAQPFLSPTQTAPLSASRATVNSLIVSLNTEKQTLANDELAVTAAQNALSLVQAGATPQAIQAAQAQADAAKAALEQAEIVAPFSGSVASVGIKVGDIVSPNTQAIALLPNGAFEIEVYLSEIDMTRLAVGDLADVTLDAFGSNTVFPASVSSIDKAPTMQNGVESYKATLVFTQPDPRITTGMHANATIHTSLQK